MADRTVREKRMDLLEKRQRLGNQQKALQSPEVILNRMTFDAQGRIVYGNDGTIALSAQGT